MLNLKKQLEQWGPIDGRILYPSFWLNTASGKKIKEGQVSWSELYLAFWDQKFAAWWVKEELEKIGIKYIRSWILHDKKRRQLEKAYFGQIAFLENLEKTIDRLLASRNFSEKDLGQWARGLVVTYEKFWSISFIFEVANYAAPVYLRKRLKSYVSEKYLADALQILLTPEKPSYNQQSELELFRVVLKSRNQKQLRQNLEKFATRWYWIENSYFISKVLGAGHFYKTVKSFDKRQITAKISEIKKIFVANKRTRRETAKKFGLPKQIQKEARLLAHSIWWQDHRKAKVWWLNSIVDKGSKIAERRYKIRHDDLMYYQSSEWAELLAKGTRFPRKRLQERKVTCVFHTTPKGIYEEIRGSKAQHLIRTFSNRIQQQSGQTDTIAGIPVSKGSGKVRGRVRVLKSTRQAYLMKKGEILVAPMTSPDYVPVMKRAKAVVTDVGGLMSHAAVVSRELGIPCVAGTKTATKILKSGDLVEVDANSGTVRKISHAKKHSRN